MDISIFYSKSLSINIEAMVVFLIDALARLGLAKRPLFIFKVLFSNFSITVN